MITKTNLKSVENLYTELKISSVVPGFFDFLVEYDLMPYAGYEANSMIKNGVLSNLNVAYFAINGVFWTKAGKDFLNDIILRLQLSFFLAFKTELNTELSEKYISNLPPTSPILNLSAFQGLESLDNKTPKNKAEERLFWNFEKAKNDETKKDKAFWVIKHFHLRLLSKGIMGTEKSLIDWALQNVGIKDSGGIVKDRSTLEAKCRSIYRYHEKHRYAIFRAFNGEKEEVKPKQTKAERTKELHKAQKKKHTQKKAMVIAYLDDFKRDDGSVNIYGLAKETGVSYKTVKKYVEELKK